MSNQFNRMGFGVDGLEDIDGTRLLNKIMDADSRHIVGKLEVTYTDPFLDESITATANSTGRYTYPIETADNSLETRYKWMSLNNNKLDGTFHLLPGEESTVSVGWWSTTMCDASGNFTGTKPTLSIHFDPRSMYQLRVVGDNKLNEFPVDFTVNLINQFAEVIYTETVQGNASVSWTRQLEEPVIGVVTATLIIHKINANYSTTAKIVEFYTAVQESYSTDDIVSINLLEEQMFEDQTLPIGNVSSNEIDVRLYNYNGHFNADNRKSPLYGLLKKNRRVKAWLGTMVKQEMQWFLLGTFWTTKWDAPRAGLYADFSARDRMELLRISTFSISTLYVNKSVKWLAELVLADAGLATEDYVLDNALDTIILPYAWFGRISHRDALVKLAAVALARTYCDRQGRIIMRIFEPPEKAIYSYSDDKSLFNTSFPIASPGVVNSVSVQANYRVLDAQTQIFSLTTAIRVPANSTIVETIAFDNFPATEIQAPVMPASNVTIASYEAFAWGMNITFVNNTASEISVNELTVQGRILSVTSPRVVTVEDAISIRDEGKYTYEILDNEFIQDTTLAQQIATLILNTYKDPRHDAILETRGHVALTLGDRVSVPDYGNQGVTDYTIVRQSLSWDGSLSAVVEAQKIGSD
ncbi:hypothetical protein D3C71_235010 [compost metagenome]